MFLNFGMEVGGCGDGGRYTVLQGMEITLPIYCTTKKSKVKKKDKTRALEMKCCARLAPSGTLTSTWSEIFDSFFWKSVNITKTSLQRIHLWNSITSPVAAFLFSFLPNTHVIRFHSNEPSAKFFFNSLTKYYFSCSRNKYVNNIANSFHPHKYIASRTTSGHESKSLMYNPSNRKFTSKSYFNHPRLSWSCLQRCSWAPQVLVLGSMCW